MCIRDSICAVKAVSFKLFHSKCAVFCNILFRYRLNTYTPVTKQLCDAYDKYSKGCVGVKPVPVSYTHLDVYKRQLQGRQKGLFNFDEARFSHFIDSLKGCQTASFFYTLTVDVYKRQ